MSKVNLKERQQCRCNAVELPRKLDVGTLNDDTKNHALQATIGYNTQSMKGDDWDQFKKGLYESGESIVCSQK